MSNSILESFMLNITSPNKSSVIATKETASWKNIFDKSLYNILNNMRSGSNNNFNSGVSVVQDNKSIKYGAVSQDYSDNPETVKSSHIQTVIGLSQSVELKIQNGSLNPLSSQPGNPQTGVLNNIQIRESRIDEIEGVHIKNEHRKLPFMLNNNANRYDTRINLLLVGDQLKIYARSYKQSESEILARIRNIVQSLDFKSHALSEIRFNGKSI